jgi:hypothetical protein
MLSDVYPYIIFLVLDVLASPKKLAKSAQNFLFDKGNFA